MTRSQLKLALFRIVAVGTTLSLLASTWHAVEAFSWANSKPMALAIGLVVVILNAVFACLFSLTKNWDGNPLVRVAIIGALINLFLVEFIANYLVGALLMRQNLPAEVAELVGISPAAFTYIGAYFFAGFLPVLNICSVYAVAETTFDTVLIPEDDSEGGRVSGGAMPWRRPA
jgi:hypothetical protein